MKRILSILILASVLFCSFVACEDGGGDRSDSTDTEPEIIDTEQEAIEKAKSYYDDYRIAYELRFARYGEASYYSEKAVLKYGDSTFAREHGGSYYSVSVKGDMMGQDRNGDYGWKKFEYLVSVYSDGYVLPCGFEETQ